MSSLAGATRRLGRSWLRPSTWQLRTRLVLVAMALLVAICGIVGLVSYASMDLFLNRQLDEQLKSSSQRAADFGRPPSGSDSGRPDPLEARGQGAGTLNARILGGTVSSAGILADDGTRQSLSDADNQVLVGLEPSAGPVSRKLSTGNYRLVAVQTPIGDVIITGLPLTEKEGTLGSLVWTTVFVSLGGLILIGLAGTVVIRHTMKPLEELSNVATKVSQLPLDAGEVGLAVRVPAKAAQAGTEVGNVGFALNKMLDNVSNALEARQKSETKVRQFVADASHELRTPLTAIRGYTELMKMTETFSEQGEQSLKRVESQSKRMTALVEDLLLLARLDEGRPLNITNVDVTQLVVETLSDEKVMAPDHHWKLQLPDEPVTVRADSARLHQVLVNLLANARKHTPAGTTVVAGVGHSADGSVVITVTDDGLGISPEFQDRIFARFARADASRSVNQDTASTTGAVREGSSGLGLSIVEAIMQAHGGSVEVTSRPGRTEFALRLPAPAVVI
ncbi:sensor histidine kinase [Pseudarthrobacter sp. J1738]|uniref:HAMP domain-containing sensor histidine kinase n=1 Tax=Pseudarthrobacter sp. J1738 TaxID=3420446 RepID=UPI003D2B1FB8